MLTRIWMAATAAIAIVMATMAVLCMLKYEQVLSELVRQRLGVTVEAAAGPFRSMIELGMPASMVRNKELLLSRARASDPTISEIRLFNPSGIVVASTRDGSAEPMPGDVLRVQADAQADRWSLELEHALVGGVSIRNDAGANVAGLAAYYPMSELVEPARRIAIEIALVGAALFVAFSALSIPALRLRLRGVRAALARLDGVAARLRVGEDPASAVARGHFGPLEEDFDLLATGLDEAAQRYEAGLAALPEVSPETAAAATRHRRGRRVLVAVPETRLTRRFARGLTPLVAALILAATLVLGIFAYLRIEESLTPEFTRRHEIIGTVARAAIARTVEAGVPLESLVGAGEYFGHLLEDFPEVSYFAITADRPLVEVGAHAGGEAVVLPMDDEGGKGTAIIIESNPQYLAEQFRSVVLDLAVIVIVAVLLSFELVVLVIGGSVTGPLDRVLHLVGLQAAGDFTKRLGRRGRGVIDQIGAILSARAEQLNARLAAHAASTPIPPDLPALRLTGRPPDVMRFCSVGDVRLALFLFAAADQLPLSFFSLFSRDVDNPFPWIDEGLAISLPLAAYLLTALLGAGAARPLSGRFGHRGQYLCAAGMALLANIGFCFAGNLIEVIAYSALNGVAFALASLACQDYVIDRLPREERSRSIGFVSGALFAGVFAGTALGGVIADRIGQRPVFLVAAALVLASVLLILWLMPTGDRPGKHDVIEPMETFSLNFIAPLRSFGFAALALGIIVPQIVADQVFVSYLVALALDGLGAPVADIARLMMVYFLVLIGAGYVAAKLPAPVAAPVPLIIASSAISGASLLAPLLWPSMGGYLIAAVGAGFGHGLSRGPIADLVVRFAEGPLAYLGTSSVLGASRVLERGGSVAGLLAIGALTGALGYAGATGAIAAMLIGGAVLFALSLVAPFGYGTAKIEDRT